jgi:hypothetical protein
MIDPCSVPAISSAAPTAAGLSGTWSVARAAIGADLF